MLDRAHAQDADAALSKAAPKSARAVIASMLWAACWAGLCWRSVESGGPWLPFAILGLPPLLVSIAGAALPRRRDRIGAIDAEALVLESGGK